MCAVAEEEPKTDEKVTEVAKSNEDEDTDNGKPDKPNGSDPADAEQGEIVADEIASSSKPITASSSGNGGKGGKGKGGGAGGDRDNDADQGGNSDNDGNGTEVTQAASGQDADVDTGLSETEKKGKKGKTPATDGQKEADPAVGKAKSKSTGSRHSARVPQK